MGLKTKITLSEPELVHAIQKKDKSGAEALYDMYSSSLYGVIFRIVQHEEIAEDLLQDTFIRIWNSFSSYDASKGRLFTWMVNVARNIAIDKTRSKEFRNSSKTEDIENNVLTLDKKVNSEINPEIIGLKDLIEKLKPEHKIILDLVYFEGFTHVEVAEKLEIPLGTVKTRLRNAIITLRKVFN
ncbi:RNA polymerase sigma-70 factor, ECF subfamily [Daejeonella rubra]|uniref:RNA polymerase sigma-70 factor, ECF subfamily n=1 Tax=Daejeonella rubra TaxID=990371 RepID=A0A1G9S5W5_9SPHI|nr:sigma-70 family RNA polymerase sigma factor [Daejeonella rubra]SDM30781.1 RNA polymerase sigma-70 factor, ECF subfamily [Daejeonella rubra]